MRYVLSNPSIGELRRFSRADTLVGFDFDGVLAPIAARPQGAGMRASTHRLLRTLAELRPCLVLSGRARADLAAKLAGSGIRLLVGNHGAEPWIGAAAIRASVVEWERRLARRLPDLDGLWVENKGLSLTIHYRQCRDKQAARAGIVEAVSRFTTARVMEGKQSYGVVSRRAPNKGDALVAVAKRLQFSRAVYVGDDVTDEDAFAAASERFPVFSIRVGTEGNTCASFYLHHQAEIDRLLGILIEASGRPPEQPVAVRSGLPTSRSRRKPARAPD